MKPQQFVMLVIALACGLGAMVMTQRLLSKKDPVDNVATVPVVVAAEPINPGQVIKDTMVRLADLEEENVPEGAIRDLAEVIGKSVRYPLSEKQIVVQSAFPVGGGRGIAALLEEGKRAVTVPSTADRAVAGFVKPDDFVDIILNVKQRGPNQTATSKIILQNVRVLAVDRSMENDMVEEGKVLEMVTFLLTPDEVELLTLAQNSGTISMSLRNPGDTAMVSTRGASLEKVLASSDREVEEVEIPEPVMLPEEKEKPGFLSMLGEMLAQQREREAETPVMPEPVEAAPTPEPEPVVEVVEAPQPPRKERKWLVYRDVAGNELMRVLVDADSDIAARLKDQLEDAKPVGYSDDTTALPADSDQVVAFPGKRS